MSAIDRGPHTALNRVCPYFTMFPLRFPYELLRRYAGAGDRILDPFCGRGTTCYAARLLGMDSAGIDSSPVAASIAEAKVIQVTPSEVMATFDALLEALSVPRAIPEGEFWQWAFHADVLSILCRLREGLLHDCTTPARKALRAILLGALHGPLHKRTRSYLSNQAPRTFAPKPDYAVRWWKWRGLLPQWVNVREIVRVRAERYYGRERSQPRGMIVHADSRDPASFTELGGGRFSWVITSPPYYGLRTYLPDQWLRNWLVGGPEGTDYSNRGQIAHRSPQRFADELRQVWRLVAHQCHPGARLVIRFGSINNRRVDPIAVITDSLDCAEWKIIAIHGAGYATAGKRQALHFGFNPASPCSEYDVWAIRL
ncbi:MAG TPA: DNA methyltransferase [Candidatus Dormibacteraeota bacterium]|nr:DNA methyltransferase [Candidatus Dormibacteraeota bacterium]